MGYGCFHIFYTAFVGSFFVRQVNDGRGHPYPPNPVPNPVPFGSLPILRGVSTKVLTSPVRGRRYKPT